MRVGDGEHAMTEQEEHTLWSTGNEQLGYGSWVFLRNNIHVHQSSSVTLALLFGLRVVLAALTTSSSLSPVLRMLALARFLRWYSLSRSRFCWATVSSWFLGAGGTITVVSPGVGCLTYSSWGPPSSFSPTNSRDYVVSVKDPRTQDGGTPWQQSNCCLKISDPGHELHTSVCQSFDSSSILQIHG
jgi:hypothetical protein